MTERLYYSDSYLCSFTASIIDRSADGRTLYLDRTAFYPTSGGQPHDTGFIAGIPLLNVVDEEDRIAHQLASAVPDAAGGAPDCTIDCVIDWNRRFDHMQQHTGQHLLSAVFQESFGLKTVSFHLGAESSTIDLEGAPLDSHTVQEAEQRANQLVFENRPVRVDYQHAAEVRDLRKPSEREGTLRIVSIHELDRSACGGTHVRSTGEIGPILLRKLDKVRQATRVEFLCGGRAVRRARADYEALYKTAQLFRAQLDEVPVLVAAQLESANAGEKLRRKLELDLAGYQGKELYDATGPGADGLRRVSRRVERGSLEDWRGIAQSFTAQPKAFFAVALGDPPSVLVAVSADAGIDAGKLLKVALAEAGGRGGGTARAAQGSVPNAGLLDAVLQKLSR
jgi:alanyl-tRNA synthetase